MEKFDHIFIAPKDFEKSYAFYKDNLGWNVVNSWGEEDEPRGAILKSDGGMTLVIAEEDESKGSNGTRPTIHLNCDSLDQRYEILEDKDNVVIEPEDNHWGSRWMVLEDPDGNLIAYSTPKESK